MTDAAFHDSALGLRLLRMRNPAKVTKWVARRVDDVTFLDHVTVAREVTFDLDLSDVESLPRLHDAVLLPVATFPVGGRHTSITALDASGALLSRLTMDEERALVFAGLLAFAEEAVGGELELEDQNRLHDVTVRRILPPSALAGASAKSQALHADDVFTTMVLDAHLSFNLVVVVPDPAPPRMVVRLIYREPLTRSRAPKPAPDRKPRIRRALAGFGYLAPCPGMSIRLDADEAGSCRSYHIQARAPYDLHFERGATLRVTAAIALAPETTVPSNAPSSSEVHFFWSRTQAINQGTVRVRLVPIDKGLLRAAALSTAFIALVLILGTAYAWLTPITAIHKADASSSTAILLLAPAVLASGLAGPAQHSLTTRVLFVSRMAVYVGCTALFAGAVTVALHAGTEITQITWTLAAAAGTAAALFSFVRLMRVRNRLQLRP